MNCFVSVLKFHNVSGTINTRSLKKCKTKQALFRDTKFQEKFIKQQYRSLSKAKTIFSTFICMEIKIFKKSWVAENS
jgi:hypothetical protein